MSAGTYYAVARDYLKKIGKHFVGKSASAMRAEMSKHTPACLAARNKECAELAAYEKHWPRYCRKCGGEGGLSDQVYEPCPDCVGQGICPRCGSISNNFEDNDVEQLRCATCDWREGMAGAPEVMNPYECGCDENALDFVHND